VAKVVRRAVGEATGGEQVRLDCGAVVDLPAPDSPVNQTVAPSCPRQSQRWRRLRMLSCQTTSAEPPCSLRVTRWLSVGSSTPIRSIPLFCGLPLRRLRFVVGSCSPRSVIRVVVIFVEDLGRVVAVERTPPVQVMSPTVR